MMNKGWNGRREQGRMSSFVQGYAGGPPRELITRSTGGPITRHTNTEAIEAPSEQQIDHYCVQGSPYSRSLQDSRSVGESKTTGSFQSQHIFQKEIISKSVMNINCSI